MNNVYDRLKELRKAKDISQAELAEKLNLTPAGYGKLERGDVQLTIERAYELATIFGVSVVELLGEGASVVVVGGAEGAKELEAIKAKNDALERELKDLRELLESKNENLQTAKEVLIGNILFFQVFVDIDYTEEELEKKSVSELAKIFRKAQKAPKLTYQTENTPKKEGGIKFD